MWLSEVPLSPKTFGIKIDFHYIEAFVPIRETEVVVVQAIGGNLTTDVLNLMPEVGNYQARPGSVPVQTTINRTDDLNLPRSVVERLRSPVEAPTPFRILGIVEEGIELICPTGAGIGEPPHGNQVPVCRLYYTALA